jgi:hypothetical protein
MKHKQLVSTALVCLVLLLSFAPAAQAASDTPLLPSNTVSEAATCDAKTNTCVIVFHSTPGKSSGGTLTMSSPTTNLYICGIDVYRFGVWYGRLQQNVYGSWGWGQYQIQWKLDSGNLTTSAGSAQWWGNLNGPNPDVPWGTITLTEHVTSGGRLYPWTDYHWVDAYFKTSGGYSCTGG